jgi:hypothetical protein
MDKHLTSSELDLTKAKSTLMRHFDTRLFWGRDAKQEARATLWNAGPKVSPIGLVRCQDVADVRFALSVAQDHGLPVSVLAGGHDPSVRSVRERAIVLDLRMLNTATFMREQNVVQVGGGATTRNVLDHLPPGKAVVTGTFQTVGLASFVMGGGYGRLNSYFGMGVDQLLEADLLLADGGETRASGAQNQDLFWAIRGGGGNFGVVTGMTLRVHSVPSLLTALILFALPDAKEAMLQVQSEIDNAEEHGSLFSGFMAPPTGDPVYFLAPLWIGDREKGEQWIERLCSWRGAQLVSRQWSPYRDLFSEEFEQRWPKGRSFHLNVQNVGTMTPEIAGLLIEAAHLFTSPMSSIVIHDVHGAATRVGPHETAFPMRQNHYAVQIIAGWNPQTESDEHRVWADELSGRLAAHSLRGAYVNLLHPDEESRVRDFYGDSVRRLLAVKRSYDPRYCFVAPGALGRKS